MCLHYNFVHFICKPAPAWVNTASRNPRSWALGESPADSRIRSGTPKRAQNPTAESADAMIVSAHRAVVQHALGDLFTSGALHSIIAANAELDAIWNQIGHDELHFDNNEFNGAYAYIASQRALIRPALEGGQPRRAWQAFGRLTHTAQDFYSHSNYVGLWLESRQGGTLPAPTEIDPLDSRLVGSASLHSGRPYLPFGALSFVPGIASLVDRLLPDDSHARMHLDSADRGPAFEYAFQAAVKRTRHEYVLSVTGLPQVLVWQFRGFAAPPAHRQGI